MVAEAEAPRTPPASLDEVHLSDLEFWTRPDAEREGAFELLRRRDPIRFFSQTRGRGYYALTCYHDIVEATRHPELFCSGEGVTIGDPDESVRELLFSILSMDDPRHAQLRRIVSQAFTPRSLERVRTSVEVVAAQIVDEIIERGECDFVTDVAARLPLLVVMDLMGIPRHEERLIFDCSSVITGPFDPDNVPDQAVEPVTAAVRTAVQELTQLVAELATERRADPRDDLISVLVNATVEDECLSPQEVSSFFVLLVVAGNETTRNAIAHGLVALTEHPAQRATLLADLETVLPTAVEEIIRWSSPVMHLRRTVTRDGVELGGHSFAQGDKVVLWFNSANRDEAVFEHPYRFDVTRRPNDHLGFGGPGPHFCLGAHLARREIAVMYTELLRRIPDIRAVGAPQRLRSNFSNGIKHLTAAFTPTRASSAAFRTLDVTRDTARWPSCMRAAAIRTRARRGPSTQGAN